MTDQELKALIAAIGQQTDKNAKAIAANSEVLTKTIEAIGQRTDSNAKAIEALTSDQGSIRAALKEQGDRTDRQLVELIQLMGNLASEAAQDRANQAQERAKMYKSIAQNSELIAQNSETQAQILQSLQDIAAAIGGLKFENP